ncbi:MAG: hypothetical protein JKY98_01955 [Gammaproteobacteria bacterium]|nr:hypothetical protein [Gammaproteobacteria bacterium]
MGQLIRPVYFLFLLSLPFAGFTQDDNHSRFWQELESVDNDFSRAATERGRTEAFLDVLGEGSVLFRQGPVDARELYRRNQTIYALDQLSWRRHFIDVSRDGDLGITVGPNVFTANQEAQNDEERQQRYSYLVNVWHNVNGDWKLMVDMTVRVPGFLSMDVEPKYEDTLLVMAETAHPSLTGSNDLQGLIDADALFSLSINFRGGQRAMLRYGLEHQRVYLTNMAPAVGTAAASKAYGNFLDLRVATTNPISATYMGGFLSSSKELGYTYGIMTTDINEGTPGFKTNYLRVWRYTKDREWKITMEFLSEY